MSKREVLIRRDPLHQKIWKHLNKDIVGIGMKTADYGSHTGSATGDPTSAAATTSGSLRRDWYPLEL